MAAEMVKTVPKCWTRVVGRIVFSHEKAEEQIEKTSSVISNMAKCLFTGSGEWFAAFNSRGHASG